MSEFINTKNLAEDVVLAIDRNLKGEARRIYIDAYSTTSDLVVKFVKDVEEALNKRFEN